MAAAGKHQRSGKRGKATPTKAAGRATPGRTRPALRRSADPLGYRLGEEFRPGFDDDPELTRGQRLRIAGWARALTPERLSEVQRELLEGFEPDPSPARRLAEEQSSYQASPIWRLLDETQRERVEDPSRHPNLGGYPLRTAELAELVGATEDQVRYWSDAGLLPARRTPGGQRRFYAAAAMWAYLLVGLSQPMLTLLRRLNEGKEGRMLVALGGLLREGSFANREGQRRELLHRTAANLQELGLAASS